jgi:hypothetical protein
MFCLMLVGSMANPSASGIGVSLPQDGLRAFPINVVGTANIDYNLNVRSGNNVSVYLINQDQLTSLENGSSFPSYPDWNFEGVSHASKSGNLTTGSYFLVIVNGLSANSTGSVTIDYNLIVGGQLGQMTIIGWIWSVIALASMIGVAVGIFNLDRKKSSKKTARRKSKRPDELRYSR